VALIQLSPLPRFLRELGLAGRRLTGGVGVVRCSSTAVGSIQMSPAYSIMPVPAYKVSKAALNMLTVQWALAYGKEHGFTFLSVSPGVSVTFSHPVPAGRIGPALTLNPLRHSGYVPISGALVQTCQSRKGAKLCWK
jgi:NAD(P)-dependent dehydrogenase (short-subunit alcohol dehydrogenase family)